MPRYQRHLEAAHRAWEKYRHAAIAIDATCGNGYDTLFLAELELKELYALDLNAQAIEATKKRVSPSPHVHFFCQSHVQFPRQIEHGSVDLIVYNLGYLPGGDKTATTLATTTLKSLNEAKLLLKPGGLISVTCYPGHPEGEVEETALVAWAKTLDPRVWNVQFHQWINREKSPSLLLIEKISCQKLEKG